jgi:hypothetical protein
MRVAISFLQGGEAAQGKYSLDPSSFSREFSVNFRNDYRIFKGTIPPDCETPRPRMGCPCNISGLPFRPRCASEKAMRRRTLANMSRFFHGSGMKPVHALLPEWNFFFLEAASKLFFTSGMPVLTLTAAGNAPGCCRGFQYRRSPYHPGSG